MPTGSQHRQSMFLLADLNEGKTSRPDRCEKLLENNSTAQSHEFLWLGQVCMHAVQAASPPGILVTS